MVPNFLPLDTMHTSTKLVWYYVLFDDYYLKTSKAGRTHSTLNYNLRTFSAF